MSLRIVLAASAVVALTAFLYVKTQTVDLERHEEVRQALGELTEISARLSEDVLKLRCSLLTNYDSVANSQRRFVGTLERLRTMYTNPSSPQETEILEGIAACRKALVEKGDLAEEFKSQSAVLENSLDYLPILGFSLSTKETGNAEVLRIVDDLVRDTLAYNRNAQKELLSRIGESIQRLGDLHSSLGAEHLRQEEFLIAHVQNVLRTKPIVDGLLGRIASVPVAERIEQLRGSVAWDYDQGVRSASWYRRLLLVLSGALLVAITVVLAKLQQKARLLAGANRDLEASVLDVARKEAETRAILEGAADGILSLDDQGLVRSMNPTAERLFGHPGGAALGRPFESLVSSGWETLKTRLGLKQETLGKNKDGTFVSLELVLTGIDVGDRKVFIALLQDITERKRVDSLKDEFVSTVSHELRTPLTSIRGSLGLISHGVIGVLPPTVKGMLDIAVKNCDRLVGLVNDILDVEKIASGKMVLQMRAFELGPLLAQAVEVNRPFADACGVKLELEVPERTHVATGDTDRLMQVLTNLVSNACKFSPRGETVRLRVSPAGARVRVSVSDRGPGIPEEFRPRMFQKFAQAGAGDGAAKKGTGLGLAISKAFIEKMGGTIGFTTETGKGTTFHFELDERKTEAAAAPLDLREPRVLICEDEPNIASVLSEMLSRDGFASDVAMTIGEARRLLALRSYAAMTLDLILPDGFAVPFMKEIRECPKTAEMPVIVVSACLEADQRQLGGQAFSIIDWLEKPISPERLSRALARIGKGAPGLRPRILHVEDDPDICQVVRDLLQDSAVIDQSGSVLDAWEKLLKEDYDLLLLDVGLPDGSGLELLPALRKSTSRPIPSLVFSAHELSPRTSKYVSAALLKSKTSNEELVRRIHSLLPEPTAPQKPQASLAMDPE